MRTPYSAPKDIHFDGGGEYSACFFMLDIGKADARVEECLLSEYSLTALAAIQTSLNMRLLDSKELLSSLETLNKVFSTTKAVLLEATEIVYSGSKTPLGPRAHILRNRVDQVGIERDERDLDELLALRFGARVDHVTRKGDLGITSQLVATKSYKIDEIRTAEYLANVVAMTYWPEVERLAKKFPGVAGGFF